MLDPLRFSDPIVRVYEACVDELLINLARHFNVKATGITESFRYETELLAKMGAIRKESASIIASHVSKNEPMIRLAVEKSMLEALETVEPELAQAAIDGMLNEAEMPVSDGIKNTLDSYSRQAVNQMNLVNTVMLDGTAKAYRAGIYAAVDIVRDMSFAQEALNVETGKVIIGEKTLQSAIRSACTAMQRQGITGFVDNSGKRWSAEAYVRMDIKTTCANAANQGVIDRNGQYGNDLIWVRTNATARPGCFPWQGKVISMANLARDVVDGAGKKVHAYAASETTYGQPDGIYGINCHHGPMNVFIPGSSRVRGTNMSINQAENDARYQLVQHQRKLEREVRYAKRELEMLKAAGASLSDVQEAASKVRRKQAAVRELIKANPERLVRDYSREAIYN